MEICEKIRKQRLKLGLTLEEVAKYVGVARNTVQRWESGERANISYNMIPRLSEILKLSPDYLLGIEPQRSSKMTVEISDPAEIRLINAYREANKDTKKAARAVLGVKGNKKNN